MLRFATLALVVLLIQGCATLSKEECLYADWYQIGYEDGSRGKEVLQLSRHRKACAKAGVTPDRISYEKGHHQGLLNYCTYQTGLRLGSNGNSMPQFCPQIVRADFSRGFEHGQERYYQTKIIKQIESEIRSVYHAIDEHEDYIDKNEHIIVNDNSTKEQRKEALAALRILEDEIAIFSADLFALEESLEYEESVLNKIIYSQQR
jgi:hypothetical protein